MPAQGPGVAGIAYKEGQMNPDLGPLFEAAATEEAIQRVEEANSPDPMEMAYSHAVKNLRRLPDLVSSDTILPSLSQYGFTDNRAMGPLMRRLMDAGHIQPTGEFRKSTRPGNHRVPKAVYRNERAYCISIPAPHSPEREEKDYLDPDAVRLPDHKNTILGSGGGVLIYDRNEIVINFMKRNRMSRRAAEKVVSSEIEPLGKEGRGFILVEWI